MKRSVRTGLAFRNPKTCNDPHADPAQKECQVGPAREGNKFYRASLSQVSVICIHKGITGKHRFISMRCWPLSTGMAHKEKQAGTSCTSTAAVIHNALHTLRLEYGNADNKIWANDTDQNTIQKRRNRMSVHPRFWVNSNVSP